MNPASNRARAPKPATLLRLYIADETMAAEQALVNLRNLCEYHVEDQYELETVDILRQPLRAMREGVLVTPALLRLTPLPVRKIVGDLSDCKAVLHALGLNDRATNDTL
jgi:circadian clock protein KaiB